MGHDDPGFQSSESLMGMAQVGEAWAASQLVRAPQRASWSEQSASGEHEGSS